MNIVLVLTILIALIQSWWVIAYFYAYTQVREQKLLLQVIQGGIFGLLFVLIAISILSPQFRLNGPISALLIAAGFVPGFIWRRKDGVTMLLEYYPNGIIDVMMFQKPQTAASQQAHTTMETDQHQEPGTGTTQGDTIKRKNS